MHLTHCFNKGGIASAGITDRTIVRKLIHGTLQVSCFNVIEYNSAAIYIMLLEWVTVVVKNERQNSVSPNTLCYAC
jgi:hypothetical protein